MGRHLVARRSTMLACALLMLGLALEAGPTLAQYGGLPGVNPADMRLRGQDWGIDESDLEGVDLRKVKTAYRKGLEFLNEKECRQATEQFNLVLSVLPENAKAHYLAGSADRCEGNFEGAVSHYERAIEIDESMYLAYKNLGVSYLALGDLESATAPLGQLEVKRLDCESSCPEELESARADLKKVIELVKAR